MPKLKTMKDVLVLKVKGFSPEQEEGIKIAQREIYRNSKLTGFDWLQRHKAMAMDTKLVEDFIKHFFHITDEELEYIERKGKELADRVDEEIFKELETKTIHADAITKISKGDTP